MPHILGNLNLSSLRPSAGIRVIEPIGIEGNVAHLSRALDQWITDAGWTFSCQGIDLSSEEMTASDGLLPLVLHQAQECLARATGSRPSQAIVHHESETGLCGVSISQLKAMSIGQWLLLSSFALEERVREHGMETAVPVDGWYEGWQKALQQEVVIVLPTPTSPQMGSSGR